MTPSKCYLTENKNAVFLVEGWCFYLYHLYVFFFENGLTGGSRQLDMSLLALFVDMFFLYLRRCLRFRSLINIKVFLAKVPLAIVRLKEEMYLFFAPPEIRT